MRRIWSRRSSPSSIVGRWLAAIHQRTTDTSDMRLNHALRRRMTWRCGSRVGERSQRLDVLPDREVENQLVAFAAMADRDGLVERPMPPHEPGRAVGQRVHGIEEHHELGHHRRVQRGAEHREIELRQVEVIHARHSGRARREKLEPCCPHDGEQLRSKTANRRSLAELGMTATADPSRSLPSRSASDEGLGMTGG